MNGPIPSPTSPEPGVNWFYPTNKWQVQVSYRGLLIGVGHFKDHTEAVIARRAAQRVVEALYR